jgi:hypothetical protein
MITLTIQASTLPELVALLAQHSSVLAPPTGPARDTLTIIKEHHERLANKAAAQPVEKPVEKPVEAAPPAVAYSDVQKAVFDLSTAKGKPAVLAVFEGLGISHAKELAEQDWPKAIAALREATGDA